MRCWRRPVFRFAGFRTGPREMASSSVSSSPGVMTKTSIPHVERTAGEPRGETFHALKITDITHPNPLTRLFRLSPSSTSSHAARNDRESGSSFSCNGDLSRTLPAFTPGQWVDFYAPNVSKIGGFTITSAPGVGYLELAVQKASGNPVAEWLWQREDEVLGRDVRLKVGGAFVWPPSGFLDVGSRSLEDGTGDVKDGRASVKLKKLKMVVFVAGGVGINPLMAMISHLNEGKVSYGGNLGFEVVLLYSSKDVPPEQGEILFLSRLNEVFRDFAEEGHFKLFVTGGGAVQGKESGQIEKRRMTEEDLVGSLGGSSGRDATVCYVCGVPRMTDWAVDVLRNAEGMDKERVFCEKWW